MSRIDSTFFTLQQQSKKALIPFISAGDPNPAMTVPLLHALVASGADILELGVPFSDPMADGPLIQRASERSLKFQTGLADVLNYVAEFRKTDSVTPVVLMGYANPIEAMGYQVFAKRAAEVGVDGVLTVDYPPDEKGELLPRLVEHNIDPIFLLSPTTPEARIEKIAVQARGYVYYVSLKGVTGAAHLDLDELGRKLPELRKKILLPIGVGFGIRDAQTAKAVSVIADAVIIGSRLIQEIEQSPSEKIISNISVLMQGIRSAIDEK